MIQPYPPNPFYWEYKSKPVVLLGGSVEDNLFQIDDLGAHLDLLASVGGNYVRCTMSSRDEGDAWPFERDPATGLYDLNQPSQEYFNRMARFLELTAAHEIIIQIELWDRFDFARAPWQSNPYNPQNNINYGAEESGLPTVIETHPGRRENGFFRSVPDAENNPTLLYYQHLQVDTLLGLTLDYDHVLYCMDNETNEPPAWGAYWANYVHARAAERDVTVHVTEMWDDHDLQGAQHRHTLDHPELYSFVDVSQNNHQSGWTHWQNLQYVRDTILQSAYIRPMNTVKIYGANTGRYGTGRDAQERFWRNIFGGVAATRFHRPTSGLGLNAIAQAHIRAMRMLLDEISIFECKPHTDLLDNRSANEAYCTANPGSAYAVFFPDGGAVWLDVSGAEHVRALWLDIRAGQWVPPAAPLEIVEGRAHLVTPHEEGYWAVVLKA